MRLRPGQPNEIRSDVPSHVTSVTTTTTAAITIVRRRGILQRILSVGRAGGCRFGAPLSSAGGLG